jgi:AcrR family transcriptional regulator
MIRQRQAASVRKRQIITAARRLILKEGSEHLTVFKMARQIGVSEAAIYRHFESKKEILSFLLEDTGRILNPESQKPASSDSDALGSLERLLVDQISAINQRKGISFHIIAEIISLGDKELNRRAYDVIRKFVDHIKEALGDGVAQGQVRQDINLESFSVLLFGMMQGLVTMWTLSRYSFDIEEKYRYLWRTLRASISETQALGVNYVDKE